MLAKVPPHSDLKTGNAVIDFAIGVIVVVNDRRRDVPVARLRQGGRRKAHGQYADCQSHRR